jgi:hypothetical protein
MGRMRASIRSNRAWPWHYKKYEREQSTEDRVAYALAEGTARAERRGLWRDPRPVPPWAFRMHCGRFAITTAKFNQIEGRLATTVPEVHPRYKISPSPSIPVIRESAEGAHEPVEMRCGFAPLAEGAQDPLQHLQRPRRDLPSRRCLFPASGFYEWKTEAGPKQPYYLTDDSNIGCASPASTRPRSGRRSGKYRAARAVRTVRVSPSVTPTTLANELNRSGGRGEQRGSECDAQKQRSLRCAYEERVYRL